MMILAGAALACSLVATGADARGFGGGGFGGGFGGGHIGGFGGGFGAGHFGGFRGGHGFSVGNLTTGRSVGLVRPPLAVGGSCTSWAGPQGCTY
jgi:hypothetical protein